MPKEIERKFLVRSKTYRKNAKKHYIKQAFLSRAKKRVVRIRILDDDGFLTIKGISKGSVRREYEYRIPRQEAEEMISNLCKKPIIEKYRYVLEYKGHVWEVDEFMGENEGLILAEIELDRPEQEFEKPSWLGEEVTEDNRYFNSNLSKYPYKNWTDK
ncbi:MAG: CYTH domain-containing protein [Bacteroidales bacterium]|nr:CYTH domain-containing protein [Bacteroidales bacterium]MCF8343173.1 CYTH domain-containing protein [Bacteroidales bacterium]MCF8350666.1 CYTH domain-containing protein [Bacteroidales bacterium]MCF8376832.1 CYTH domain-containing protein [Bacteroidales bacterium]MCF8400739.1 CYTH domain-containing protein [Bacteroidales bacterium]